MLARFESDWSKKRLNAFVLCWVLGCLRWARNDSRPVLKANEPRGRAESERSNRACKDAGLVASNDIVSIYEQLKHIMT